MNDVEKLEKDFAELLDSDIEQDVRDKHITTAWVLLKNFTKFVDEHKQYKGEVLYDDFIILNKYTIRNVKDNPNKDCFVIVGDIELDSRNYLIPKEWLRDPDTFLNNRFMQMKSDRMFDEFSEEAKEKERVLNFLKEHKDCERFVQRVLNAIGVTNG